MRKYFFDYWGKVNLWILGLILEGKFFKLVSEQLIITLNPCG